MYHPNLGVECEVPTTEAAAVLAESGWRPAPEPDPTPPGVVPEPVVYAPVSQAKPKPKTKTTTEPADGAPGGHD